MSEMTEAAVQIFKPRPCTKMYLTHIALCSQSNADRSRKRHSTAEIENPNMSYKCVNRAKHQPYPSNQESPGKMSGNPAHDRIRQCKADTRVRREQPYEMFYLYVELTSQHTGATPEKIDDMRSDCFTHLCYRKLRDET